MQFFKLSNQELESQLLHFVRQERKLLHLILLHIREVDKRKLYLEKARASLFDYLVKDLGYSAAAAQRRVEASRLLKDIPVLAEKIQTGSVNLSQIGEFQRAIKQKEQESAGSISTDIKTELLCKIENKTTFETQKILAQELDIQLRPLESKQVQKDESVHLQMTLSKEQYAMFQECKNLAAHILLQQKDTGMNAVLDVLMKSYLDEHKSTSVQEPISEQASTQTTEQKPWRVPKPHAISASETVRINKTLTPKTRKIVLNKHQCCQYKDPETQKICGSRFALEVDHLQPRWAGGDHQPENLTVLCSSHNKYKYQKQARASFR
jgi:hypothetical protein